jgi:hypothetical protein
MFSTSTTAQQVKNTRRTLRAYDARVTMRHSRIAGADDDG